MIKYCDICNSAVELRPYKGINLNPVFCSFECFMSLCRKIGRPLPHTVNIKKNKSVKVFRSSLESEFARLLDSRKVKYMFEPYIITKKIKNKTRYYLPDFFLPNFNIFIEIKGDIWGNGAYPKYKEMIRDIPLILVTKDLLNIIKKPNRDIILKGEVMNDNTGEEKIQLQSQRDSKGNKTSYNRRHASRKEVD